MASQPFTLVPLDLQRDIQNPPPRPESIVGGHFVEKNLNIVAGQPGSYKTLAMLEIVSAIALGRLAFDVFPVAEGRAIFITGDDPQPVLIDRLIMLNSTIDSRTNKRIVLPEIREKLSKNLEVYPLERVVTPLDRRVREQLKERMMQCSFAVLDPLRHFIGHADENKSNEIYEPLVALRELATETECAISVVHHSKKTTSEDKMNDFRGSSAIRGLSRAMISIERTNFGVDPPQISIVGENRYNEEPKNINLEVDKQVCVNGTLLRWLQMSLVAEINAIVSANKSGITTNEIIKAVGTERAVAIRRALYKLRDKGIVESHKYEKESTWVPTGKINTGIST